MAGRVLRPADGKTKALMLDHSGTAKRLGFPTDDLPLELNDGKPRTGSAAQERDEPLPKPCPSCHYLKPAKVSKCPACGFKPERQSDVEVQDGMLTKLTRSKGKKVNDYGTKQEVYSMLLGVAQQRGYSNGWVSHKYRTLFDVWPRGLNDEPMPCSLAFSSWIRSQNIRWAKGQEKAKEGAYAPA
jgi:DNA repair protein RadD